MDIQEIQGVTLVYCEICGCTGFLYEMVKCDGGLIHAGCVNDECNALERVALVA